MKEIRSTEHTKIKIHPCDMVNPIVCFATNTDPGCGKCWIEVDSIEQIAEKYRDQYEES